MVSLMSDQENLFWISNRMGFGLSPSEMELYQNQKFSELIEKRIDPEKHGLEIPAEPFKNAEDFIPTDKDSSDFKKRERTASLELFDLWLDEMRDTSDPVLEWMTFFWHDHFAVSAREVKSLRAFVRHLRLLRTHARGSYPTMLREVTIDPAMLIFLDGYKNTAKKPNENYGRELLELYSLGIGNYSEDDVMAASRALTGWRVIENGVEFKPRQHDDTPQILLGNSNVHDLDTVIEAVVNHEALPRFISRKLSDAVLGTEIPDAVINEFAAVFANNDLELIPLIEAIVDAGLSMNKRVPIIRHPVSWLLNAEKVTGVKLDVIERANMLSQMNMLPGRPPNVGGFPKTDHYLSASSTAARFSSAGIIVSKTPRESVALQAAKSANWGDLANICGHTNGFNQPTIESLQDLWESSPSSSQGGRVCLAIALSSPDFMVI